MTKETGGPAFPLPSGWNPNGEWMDGAGKLDGMTLRDYFAAKAMLALIAHPDSAEQPAEIFAKSAYHMADAMLKTREQ